MHTHAHNTDTSPFHTRFIKSSCKTSHSDFESSRSFVPNSLASTGKESSLRMTLESIGSNSLASLGKVPSLRSMGSNSVSSLGKVSSLRSIESNSVSSLGKVPSLRSMGSNSVSNLGKVTSLRSMGSNSVSSLGKVPSLRSIESNSVSNLGKVSSLRSMGSNSVSNLGKVSSLRSMGSNSVSNLGKVPSLRSMGSNSVSNLGKVPSLISTELDSLTSADTFSEILSVRSNISTNQSKLASSTPSLETVPSGTAVGYFNFLEEVSDNNEENGNTHQMKHTSLDSVHDQPSSGSECRSPILWTSTYTRADDLGCPILEAGNEECTSTSNMTKKPMFTWKLLGTFKHSNLHPCVMKGPSM